MGQTRGIAAEPEAQRYVPEVIDAAGILVVAFALRFGVVLLSDGGPGGMYGYDSGVYYSAAVAFVHGRLPYSDFVFLHPPGTVLVLAPFAALGRVTSDHTGYVAANTFFNLLAAANAVLVWFIARRWRAGRRAAVIGGLFYALWWGAINAEIGVRLEPLGSFAFVGGIAVLVAGRKTEGEPTGGLRAALAGSALAGAASVKIWWFVPLLVVLGWHLARGPTRRTGLALTGGALAGAVVINGPFVALAGHEMWARVVTDQLGRPYAVPPFTRLKSLAGLSRAVPDLSPRLMALAVLTVGVIFVATIVAAWQLRPARMIVAVLVVQFLVLMLSPAFFNFYSGFVAGPLALTVAAAAQPRRRTDRLRPFVAAAATVTAAVIALPAIAHSRSLVMAFPGARLERAATGLRCVMTDSNSVLILTNRLSLQFDNGCPNWVDVTGHTYFGPARADVSRPQNARWQADLRRYLFFGDGMIVVRPGTGYSTPTRRLIRSHPVLFRVDGYVLYGVGH
jgi:alpha-1,2-mannosyltransferase